ncbi:MAG TPA: ABC transporter ATP-binding protein [Solirubrobacteraceae bacterium]|jgi:branched-chain amino acid transport system ATP-binding protein
MIAPVLELRGVSKRFGGIRALEEVSLAVQEGSTVAIIGPNGAGKSTLFALVSGELQPSEGTILLAGRALGRLSAERRARAGLGRTFQSARLFAGLTVRENVELALVRRGRREEEVREALAEVSLLERIERRAGALAQGERKRLELAMVLAQRPRLLLLDEPTAGMGAQERATIMELIVGAVDRRGLTMVFSEHDMDTVFAHAQRIVVLDRGAVVADGSPQMVRADERVQEIYLGSAT